MRDFSLPGRAPLHAPGAAAATSHPLASAEALCVLRAGGSAADAAIAACAVQCVVEPHMTGIGGDCFVMVKPPQQQPLALNASGHTPAALDAQWLEAQGIGEIGETSALTVTIPGAVAGWRALHRRYGRLPWRGLFRTAIEYAKTGYPLAARTAQDWAQHRARVQHDAAAAALFLPQGRAPAAGAHHHQPALARTLMHIADDGGEALYRGAIARQLTAKLNQAGAPHTAADFAEYQPQWQEAIYAEFRGWKVWECPPNGQGIVALLMLALHNDLPVQKGFEVQRLLHYAHITKYAYAWRDNLLGDADADWPGLMRAAYAGYAAGQVPPAAPAPPPPHSDTVYLSVIDGDGLAVSFINSLFQPFGSGLLEEESGILLHNRGFCFARAPGQANSIGARKRPLHTIIPAIAEGPNGEVLSFGVMGGHYQAAGHVWFLSRLLDDGDDLQQALDAPRLFNYPDALQVEKTLPQQQALAAAGLTCVQCEEPLGGGQAVLRRADGMLTAASDFRKDGMAVGF